MLKPFDFLTSHCVPKEEIRPRRRRNYLTVWRECDRMGRRFLRKLLHLWPPFRRHFWKVMQMSTKVNSSEHTHYALRRCEKHRGEVYLKRSKVDDISIPKCKAVRIAQETATLISTPNLYVAYQLFAFQSRYFM